MDLSDLTWTDVRDLEPDVALLPVGSTEQHGPHAPLGTDSIAATAIAREGAAACDRPVVVAPTVPVGVAEEHRGFDGTLWVGPDTFRAYIADILGSLASCVGNAVVVNGHGGNVDALREVCARVSRDGAVDAVTYTWHDGVDPDRPLGHGGPVETAVVQHLRPDLVHEERFEAARQGMGESFGEWVAGTNVAHDFREFTESGVIGDPSGATPETGEALIEEAVASLSAVVDAVCSRDRPAANPE